MWQPLWIVALLGCASTNLDPPVGGDGGEAVATAAVAAVTESPATAHLQDQDALSRAGQLFRAVCTGYCHTTQPGADRVAPDLFDCDWKHGDGDREIFGVIAGGVPDTQMQGFGEGKVADEDLWKIVAYLRTQSRCTGS